MESEQEREAGHVAAEKGGDDPGGAEEDDGEGREMRSCGRFVGIM